MPALAGHYYHNLYQSDSHRIELSPSQLGCRFGAFPTICIWHSGGLDWVLEKIYKQEICTALIVVMFGIFS